MGIQRTPDAGDNLFQTKDNAQAQAQNDASTKAGRESNTHPLEAKSRQQGEKPVVAVEKSTEEAEKARRIQEIRDNMAALQKNLDQALANAHELYNTLPKEVQAQTRTNNGPVYTAFVKTDRLSTPQEVKDFMQSLG